MLRMNNFSHISIRGYTLWWNYEEHSMVNILAIFKTSPSNSFFVLNVLYFCITYFHFCCFHFHVCRWVLSTVISNLVGRYFSYNSVIYTGIVNIYSRNNLFECTLYYKNKVPSTTGLLVQDIISFFKNPKSRWVIIKRTCYNLIHETFIQRIFWWLLTGEIVPYSAQAQEPVHAKEKLHLDTLAKIQKIEKF